MYLVYDGTNIHRIQQILGERPGGYRVDPFYIRFGIARKPYFWVAEEKKWVLVKLGDSFYTKDGIPHKTGSNRGSKKTG